MVVHRLPRRPRPCVTVRSDDAGHGAHREVGRRDVTQLRPRHRHRDRRTRQRPRRIRRGDRPVAVRLVEVDEHLLAAQLLPPLRRHQIGQPTLQLARNADDTVTHVEELPRRRDACIHMDATVAGRLDERCEPQRLHELLERERRLDGISEIAPRLRVEVDAQLVRIVVVLGAHGPRMKRHRVHLHAPGEHRGLVEDELLVRPGARVRAHHTARVTRRTLGRVLAEERLVRQPLRVTLQRDRPIAAPAQKRLGHGEHILDEVELRHPVVGIDDAIGTRHPDGALLAVGAGNLEGHCGGRHARSVGDGCPPRVASPHSPWQG